MTARRDWTDKACGQSRNSDQPKDSRAAQNDEDVQCKQAFLGLMLHVAVHATPYTLVDAGFEQATARWRRRDVN